MPRIPALDLARGFTVLVIAPIHTVMLYSRPDVYDTLLIKLLAFIAEGPGAQLFMLLMGFYFSLRPQTFSKTFVKSILLLGTGYALNGLKFIVPLYFNALPETMLIDLQVPKGSAGVIQLLLLGDILHFAALALIILWLVKSSRFYPWIAVAIAILVCFLSPLCWDLKSTNPIANHILQLFTGASPKVFFPVLPWLVYPLSGLVIGYCFQKNSNAIFEKCGYGGIALVITGFVLKTFVTKQDSETFYRTLPADTLQHLSIVLITLTVWDWLHRNVTANHFFRLLQYMSRHITQVYLVQWIIICWLLPFYGYHELDYLATLIAIAFTTGLTFFISALINLKPYALKKNL